MNGAVPRGVTNLTVQGKSVEIYKTGSWVTMLDLHEGRNEIEIVAGDVTTNAIVTVEKKRPPKLDAVTQRNADAFSQLYLMNRADNLACFRTGHGISPGQYFQRTQGIQLGSSGNEGLLLPLYQTKLGRAGFSRPCSSRT